MRKGGTATAFFFLEIFRHTVAENPLSTENLVKSLCRNVEVSLYSTAREAIPDANCLEMDCAKVPGASREQAYLFPHMFRSLAHLACDEMGGDFDLWNTSVSNYFIISKHVLKV